MYFAHTHTHTRNKYNQSKTGYQQRMCVYGRCANEDRWKGLEGGNERDEWCYTTSSKIFFK